MKRSFGRGPTTLLQGRTRSPWLLTTCVRHGMILQVGRSAKCQYQTLHFARNHISSCQTCYDIIGPRHVSLQIFCHVPSSTGRILSIESWLFNRDPYDIYDGL